MFAVILLSAIYISNVQNKLKKGTEIYRKKDYFVIPLQR